MYGECGSQVRYVIKKLSAEIHGAGSRRVGLSGWSNSAMHGWGHTNVAELKNRVLVERNRASGQI